MSSVQFVVHPLPGTQEQLAEKLKSVADRLNRYGQQGESPAGWGGAMERLEVFVLNMYLL